VLFTDILLLVSNKIDSSILNILDSGLGFSSQLPAVLQVSLAITDLDHFLNPILVEGQILADTKEGACPARSTTSFAFLADLEKSNATTFI
jgi:hypothetical protein